ncbi:hypothetical protein GCM10027215_19000 [Nocardioides zeae]
MTTTAETRAEALRRLSTVRIGEHHFPSQVESVASLFGAREVDLSGTPALTHAPGRGERGGSPVETWRGKPHP